MRKSKSLFTADKENNLKSWVAKQWRDYHRVNKLPSLLGNSKPDNSIGDTIQHLVGGEAPLCVQFRSDGSVIPMEEIIRYICHHKWKLLLLLQG